MDQGLETLTQSHILKAGSSTCIGLQPANGDDNGNRISEAPAQANSGSCWRGKSSRPFSVQKMVRRRVLVCPHRGCGKKYRLQSRLSQHEKKHFFQGVGSLEDVWESEQEAENFRAIKTVFKQLAELEYPSFFQSRLLPDPTAFREQPNPSSTGVQERIMHEYDSNESANISCIQQPVLLFRPFLSDGLGITYGT